MQPLILDLDFTLLHLEAEPGAIEVPGRTRSAYLGLGTVQLLHDLQNHYAVVLATARSWEGTHWVVAGLEDHDVTIQSVVLEDGALWGTPHHLHSDEEHDWAGLQQTIEASWRSTWPSFAWQHDFVACLVARANHADDAALVSQIFSHRFASGSALRVARDGRKVYLLPQSADKWSALQHLLGSRAQEAAGVGDGANDLCWLREIASPATFMNGSSLVVECVRERQGFIAARSGHRGIEDILRNFQKR